MKHITNVVIFASTFGLAAVASAQTETRPAVGQPAVVVSRPPVRDGSNQARAPLPTQRPHEYERITTDGGIPNDAKVVAQHIDSATAEQLAAMTPSGAGVVGTAYAAAPAPAATTTVAAAPASTTTTISTAPGSTTITTTEPALAPTGRVDSTVAAAPAADASASTRPEVGQPAVVVSRRAVRDRSNNSLAPLPTQRPHEYERVTTDGGIPNDAKVVAQHIDAPTAEQIAANTAPGASVAGAAYASTAAPATSVTTVEPALTPTGRVGVAVGLDSARVGPNIRAASFSGRDAVLADIEARVNAAENAISAARDSRAQMSSSGRVQFDNVADDIKAKARAVRNSLNDARKASNEQEFQNARAKLASDYEAFAQAAASVDAAMGAR